MKIVVCVKYVPASESSLEIVDDGRGFKAEPMVINETDEYALEEALAIKKKFGGEVTVITAGTVRTSEVLYYGLAKGADRAVRVDTESNDPKVISKLIAEAVKKLRYDLILTGIESADNLSAQVGVRVAEKLGIPSLLMVMRIEVVKESQTIRVSKEIGGGVREIAELPLPALLGIQSGIRPLSYVTLRKKMLARSRSVTTLTLKDLSLDEKVLLEKSLESDRYSFPEVTRRAEIIKGEPAEAVKTLLEKIRRVLA
jgi:electron transfer flavoprotein beta subunit